MDSITPEIPGDYPQHGFPGPNDTNALPEGLADGAGRYAGLSADARRLLAWFVRGAAASGPSGPDAAQDLAGAGDEAQVRSLLTKCVAMGLLVPGRVGDGGL